MLKKGFCVILILCAFGRAVCFGQQATFVPGATVIFEDNFSQDTVGGFPAKWHMSTCTKRIVPGYPESPQFCKVERDSNDHVLLMENSTRFTDPNMMEVNNLPDNFSVDFDFTFDSLGRCAELCYYTLPNKDSCLKTTVHMHYLGTLSIVGRNEQNLLTVKYPNFNSSGWHHIAVVYRNRALQVFIDKYPPANLADGKFTPHGLALSCIPPIRYRHFRVSTGGAMSGSLASNSNGNNSNNSGNTNGNVNGNSSGATRNGSRNGIAAINIAKAQKSSIAQILTEKKFVTHDILFDKNKSTITTASLTFVAELTQLMKENPKVKLEIGGHTDNAGDPKINLKLSQDRADEVKKQLVLGGVEEDRLTAIGFGSSKPLQSNKTEAGRANNRRVEFVRK